MSRSCLYDWGGLVSVREGWGGGDGYHEAGGGGEMPECL